MSWFSNSTSLTCLLESWRWQPCQSAKTTPRRSSNQSWTPNSGQVTENGSRNPALVLASEQQQSSESILTLPQQQNQQAGTQMQSASSLEGSNRSRLPRMPWVSNSPLITVKHHSQGTIVNAQLTHLISRDDAAQGQDAPNAPDVLMPHQRYMTLLHQDA